MSCQFTNEPNREISRGVFQNREVCGQAFPLLPSPFHRFFLLPLPPPPRPALTFAPYLDWKRLLRRLVRAVHWFYKGQGFEYHTCTSLHSFWLSFNKCTALSQRIECAVCVGYVLSLFTNLEPFHHALFCFWLCFCL